jgi:hypothetical protein
MKLFNMPNEFDDDFEITPEFEAELVASMQEMDSGFFYTMLEDEEGKLTKELRCNKCNRVGKLLEKPFPHRYDCEMRGL